MRVVSVLPSATEIVCALGHRKDLVGRSAECDYPPDVASLPVVMRPRTWDSDRPSREIDERVRTVRAAGESLYVLDVDRLRDLRPDVLLTQDLCGVCSVTEEEVTAACSRAGIAPRIVSLAPRRLEEVWTSVRTVANVLGDPAAAEGLLRRAGSDVRSARAGPPRPSVVVVEWLDPPILAGLWTPDIIDLAGGAAVGPAPGGPGKRMTWSEIEAGPADLLILSPCSFSVNRSRQELANPALRRAVERVAPALGTYVADEAYFSRPGPRLADGVRLVRDLLRGRLESPPMPVLSLEATLREAAA